jgi:hypothetical protein
MNHYAFSHWEYISTKHRSSPLYLCFFCAAVCVALACVRAIGVSSGVGIESSSGAISTKTASAGHSGVSGVLVFSSGTSSAGSSGSISIGSGASHGR